MQAREVGTERFMVDACGTRLALVRHGRGPEIVCLHAIGHGARDFERLAERLGDRFTFLGVDWPGHGESPRESAPPTAQRYAELLGGVADALGLRSFVLLGNSIGGAAALVYAAGHAERVRGLVLCNPGGLQRVGWLGRLVCGRMAAFFAQGARGEPGFARKFRRYYEREVLPSPAAAWRREEIVAAGCASADILREAWRGFAAPESDLRNLPRSLGCPVLFAWATGDRYVAWSRSRRAATSAPDHVVKLFPGGHAAFLEQPEAFDAALVAFLEHRARPATEPSVAARMARPGWTSARG